MAITVDHMALDFKTSTKIGEVYGFELHAHDDSDFPKATSRKATSGKVKQA